MSLTLRSRQPLPHCRAVSNGEFQEWIRSLLRSKYRTNTAIAKAIGLTLSGFRKGVKAGKLSTDNLLLLAKEAEADPSDVFRRAGKPEVDALIRKLYGAPKETSPVVRAFEAALEPDHQLDDMARDLVRALEGMRALHPPKAAPSNTPAEHQAAASGKRATRFPRKR